MKPFFFDKYFVSKWVARSTEVGGLLGELIEKTHRNVADRMMVYDVPCGDRTFTADLLNILL